MTPDGLTVVQVEKDRVVMTRMRNSAFVIFQNISNDSINITAVTKIPGSPDILIGNKIIKLISLPNTTTGIYNVEETSKELNYLEEATASEYFFHKSVPSNWFMGSFLNVSATCDKTDALIQDYRSLGLKRLNFDTNQLTAKNTFYLEFYSQLIDSAFLLVF